ncbi:MAG: DUF2292 domain-containing protein [Actinomycetota bacterium]
MPTHERRNRRIQDQAPRGRPPAAGDPRVGRLRCPGRTPRRRRSAGRCGTWKLGSVLVKIHQGRVVGIETSTKVRLGGSGAT